MSTSRRIVVVPGVLLAMGVAATTAHAAAPRAGAPTISGCVNKQTDVLRVAMPSGPCFRRPGFLQETPIQWNLTDGGAPPPVTLGQPAQVKKRTVTQTVASGSGSGATVRSTCRADETVVTGSWKADGAQAGSEPAVGYSLGTTGEFDNGYQADVTAAPRYPGDPVPAEAVTVSVTAVCLKIA